MDKISINPNSIVNNRYLKPDSELKPKGFGATLKQAVSRVNQAQLTADSAAKQAVQGELGIHEGMVALSKAEISLRLLIQVRNKAMEAYNHIMRMQF
ncbi:MAG: flagellar hook-basal body complex protein FliE [Desulfobacterales bacterium]|nr:flagellar hook-basal body complex protein FliE [Desulfobacterales bacterium]MDJ0913975.1 flagellar hook-basal body complex protein FliE [Desulfobacterales bacterium]